MANRPWRRDTRRPMTLDARNSAIIGQAPGTRTAGPGHRAGRCSGAEPGVQPSRHEEEATSCVLQQV